MELRHGSHAEEDTSFHSSETRWGLLFTRKGRLVWKLQDAPATVSQDPASQRLALAGTSPAEADGQEGAKWPAPTLLHLRPDQASVPGAGSRCSVESEDPGVAPGTRSVGGWGGRGAEETTAPMTPRSAGCLPLGLVRAQPPDQALACHCGRVAPCSLRATRGLVGSLRSTRRRWPRGKARLGERRTDTDVQCLRGAALKFFGSDLESQPPYLLPFLNLSETNSPGLVVPE